MNEKSLHIEDLNPREEAFFSSGKLTWEKSKEQAWDEVFSGIEEKKPARTVAMWRKVSVGIAASIALLIALGSFSWFFSKTVNCPTGEHFVAELPDGSVVEMNAASELKYFPVRWIVSRNLVFEGEGFFEVEKGKKFVVKSAYAKTAVLGTSFNIYSRDDLYKVACVTGKVRVTASNRESVILNSNQQVVLRLGEELKKLEALKKEEIISWRNNMFLFTATPFHNVIKEIERQYGISVSIENGLDGTLTCNFNRRSDVEEVLALVCKPLGYKFVKQTEKKYLIVRNN